MWLVERHSGNFLRPLRATEIDVLYKNNSFGFNTSPTLQNTPEICSFYFPKMSVSVAQLGRPLDLFLKAFRTNSDSFLSST